MPKLQPAVSTILINVPANGAIYADLSQMASIVNRRFYRQGLNWAVRGFRCNQKGGITAGRFQIEKLPETWVMSNAWEKSFRMWLKQQNDAIAEYGAESTVARFRDFKIHMDGVYAQSGFAANALPVMSGGATFTPGEWEASQIVIPNYEIDPTTGSPALVDPAEFFLHMVGVNFGPASVSRGMIDGYQYSRSFPQSPDPVSPAQDSNFNWMRDMFDVGNDSSEIVDNATDRNDQLPYPQVDYPGGDTQAPVLQLHAHTDITATTTAVDNSFVMQGTQVPCGLLKFTNGSDQVIEVFIDLVAGSHRGYLCEPMQEF